MQNKFFRDSLNYLHYNMETDKKGAESMKKIIETTPFVEYRQKFSIFDGQWTNLLGMYYSTMGI